jgi:hypothetical protein
VSRKGVSENLHLVFLARQGAAVSSVSTKYRCHHLCHLEMSLPSGVGRRAAGGRGAPGVAQRPTGARLSGARNRTTCLPSERQLARLVERLSRP